MADELFRILRHEKLAFRRLPAGRGELAVARLVACD
jgi:hypothetical protein